MSVQEILEQIKDLDPQQRERVREALNVWAAANRRLRSDDGDTLDQRAEQRVAERRAAVWESLDWGFCRTTGQLLTEGIDEALHGPRA